MVLVVNLKYFISPKKIRMKTVTTVLRMIQQLNTIVHYCVKVNSGQYQILFEQSVPQWG